GGVRQAPPVPLRRRAQALCAGAAAPDRGVEGLADRSAGLLRPALPGVLPQPLRGGAAGRDGFRPAGVRRQLARCARACPEEPGAGPGCRINPQVCYDLRFPVFCRTRYGVARPDGMDFDLQVFVANWPAPRAHAWKTLARARAIENLCYVAAVNRVGRDGNGLEYSGDSAVIDFLGQAQVEAHGREQVLTTTLSAAALAAHR